MAGNLTAMIAAIFSGSAVSTDPYFNLTTLLLSTTATNGQQNNTFQDSSTNNFTITRNPATGPNAPTQGTLSPFSQTGWSNYFSSANISCPNINFSTNAFCIEGWFYFTDVTTQNINLWGTTSGSGSQPKMNLVANYQYNSNLLNFDVGSFGTNPLSASMSYINNNAWNHIAIVREGTGTNQAKMYINGTARSTGTFSGNCSTITGVFNICYMGEALGIKFPGWVSNFRIVNGSPVYTADFTPSTTPLTAITNTVLLTCQANRFVDSNTQVAAKTITLTGTPTVVPFSPFNPTSAWSASTVGGSGYFSSSYLTVPAGSAFNLGTNDFCIEFWLNPIAPATYGGILSFDNNGDYPLNFSYASTNSSNLQANFGTTTAWLFTAFFDTSTTTNAWAHYVATRSGSTFRLFKNGVLKATGTSTGTIGDSSGNIYINGNSSSAGTTYISNLRIINGSIPTAYQTSSTTTGTTIFTVPTSPLTTTSQGATASDVKLLLNFTNSGIYDATAKNVLETVGSAQVSNTTSQWPTTSMLFNGTTDYLQVNTASDLYNLSSGNWTIEAWVYRTGTNQMSPISYLNGSGTTLNGWSIEVNRTSAGTLYFASYNASTSPSGSVISAGNLVPLNIWTYIAVTCVGTTVTLYVNGTNVGSGARGTIGNDSSCRLRIGGMNYTTVRYWQGYIQDPRITKGYARTISTPTAAFPVQ